jgi:arabinofuranosyltransferase
LTTLGLLVLAWHRRLWLFIGDDAYIALRYAENFAQLGLPTFNPPPEPAVEGYTSPLWVGLLALLKRAGFDLASSALALNALANCALLILACAPFQRRAQGDWPRVAAIAASMLWLALQPCFVVWAGSGLETSLAAALGLWALRAVLAKRWITASVALACTGLARLDALAWVLSGCAPMMWQLRRDRGALKPFARALLAAASVLGCHFLWRFHYYGYWLPNTWAAKSTGTELWKEWGLRYALDWAAAIGWWWIVPWFAVYAYYNRKDVAIWTGALLANLTVTIFLGGDFMGYFRFLLPATVLVGVIIRGAIVEIMQSGSRSPKIIAGAWALVGLIWSAATLPSAIDLDRRQDWLNGRYESVHAMDRFAAIRYAAGLAWRHKVDADTRVMMGAAGAMPFAAHFVAYDIYGLVDDLVARAGLAPAKKRPGHVVVASAEQIAARRPDLQCQSGYVGRKMPGANELRRRVKGAFAWSCVETGPIELHPLGAQPLPSHYYCCIQALAREVEASSHDAN